MGKRQTFSPFMFLPYRLRAQAPSGAVVYDVSSYAEHPLCTLSPFWPHGGIPVPAISTAVYERFDSQIDTRFAHQAIAALRQQFGGHAVEKA